MAKKGTIPIGEKQAFLFEQRLVSDGYEKQRLCEKDCSYGFQKSETSGVIRRRPDAHHFLYCSANMTISFPKEDGERIIFLKPHHINHSELLACDVDLMMSAIDVLKYPVKING